MGIDSELSWKHHSDITCDKIRTSVGIIAKMRYYIPRYLLLNLYHALITTYLNYVICSWGNCPQTYLNKCLVLPKRALRLIYFAKNQRPCNSFFLNESNCLPLKSLFVQQSSYLMYEVHAKKAPKSLLNKFGKSVQNITLTRDYLQRNVFLSNSLTLKKWKNLLLELLCLFGTFC